MDGTSRDCRECSKQLEPDSRFCPQCGTPVSKAPKKSCPFCNHEINSDDKFCSNCGKQVDKITPPPKLYQCVCGQSNQLNVRFCSKCGFPNPIHPQNRAGESGESTETKEKSQASSDEAEKQCKNGGGSGDEIQIVRKVCNLEIEEIRGKSASGNGDNGDMKEMLNSSVDTLKRSIMQPAEKVDIEKVHAACKDLQSQEDATSQHSFNKPEYTGDRSTEHWSHGAGVETEMSRPEVVDSNSEEDAVVGDKRGDVSASKIQTSEGGTSLPDSKFNNEPIAKEIKEEENRESKREHSSLTKQSAPCDEEEDLYAPNIEIKVPPKNAPVRNSDEKVDKSKDDGPGLFSLNVERMKLRSDTRSSQNNEEAVFGGAVYNESCAADARNRTTPSNHNQTDTPQTKTGTDVDSKSETPKNDTDLKSGSQEVPSGGAPSYAEAVGKGGSAETGAWINKKNTPAPEYQPASQSASKGKKKTAGEKAFGGETIDVFFHVVVSRDFNFDATKHHIELRSQKLGGDFTNPTTRYVMKKIRDLDESFPMMELMIRVNKSLLANGARIEYKYVRVKDGKDGEVKWEFLYKKGSSGDMQWNRSFYIPPEELLKRGEWHQYDGVMHDRPSKNLLSQIYSFLLDKEYRMLVKEAKSAAFAMLPNLSSIDKTAGYLILDDVSHVERCYRTQLVDRDLKSFSLALFGEVITSYVLTHVEKLKQLVAKNVETGSEAAHRLSLAVVLVTLCVKYQVDATRQDIRIPLLNALRVRPDNDSKSCVDFQSLVEVHLPESERSTRKVAFQCLLQFMNSVVAYNDLRWIGLLPLLHFMSDKTKPFAPIKIEREHTNDIWWGIDEFPLVIKKAKDSNKYDKANAMTMLDTVWPCFQVDRLLQRSYMAVLSWDHLQHILPRCQIDAVVCFANMHFFIFNNHLFDYDFKKLGDLLPHLRNKLAKEEESMSTEGQSFEVAVSECAAECDIAMDFLCAVFNYPNNNAHVSRFKFVDRFEYSEPAVMATRIVVAVFNKFERQIEKYNVENADEKIPGLQKLEQKWTNILYLLRDWFGKQLSYTFVTLDSRLFNPVCFDSRELEVLSDILHLEVRSTTMASRIRDTFLAVLKERIKKEEGHVKLGMFCKVEYERYHPSIEDCFTEIAFEVIESKSEIRNFEFVFNYLDKARNLEKLSDMISKLLLKGWPKKDEQYDVIHHMLTWPTFLRYLTLFCGSDDRSKLLSDPSAEVLMKSLSYLDMTWRQLKSGDILLPLLELALEHSHQFAEVHKVANKGQDVSPPFQLVAEIRRSELKKYKELKAVLSRFTAYCAQLEKVNYTELQKHIEADVTQLKLKNICRPVNIKQLKNAADVPEPMVIVFAVPPEIYQITPILHDLRESYTFTNLSVEFSKRALKQKPVLEIEDIREFVFIPALTKLREICQRLIFGQITLAEVDQIFGNFKTDYTAMQREMEIMNQGREKAWIPKRLKQIQEYHQLNTYRNGARIMQRVKDSFKLTGDFETLDLLANAGTDKHLALHTISPDVVNAGQDLKDIGSAEAECIAALHKCEELVTWLRANAESTKEIKTLVDLAMMSAQGQGAMEVQKVSCLHAAAIGYAPLIYDLKPTDGFKTFLKQCKQVWRSLRTDPDLPKHLLDTNRHLKWLKEVKESHGSVEVNALTQASNINARGVYMVGFDDRRSGGRSAAKTHENVIRLALAEETKDQPQMKMYSYSQLCDLQSKLMLVAGKAEKGMEDVERFVEILDGVTRLATSYIKLCSAGCILFKNWNATFYCDPGRGVHAEVDFGLKSKRSILRGYKKDTRQVADEIKLICEFMEACLTDWTHSIDVQREQFYFLNNFTTEQLVILCTEVAKFIIPGEKVSHSQRIFHMLDRVKKQCTKQDLEKAVKSAFADLRPADATENDAADDVPHTSEIETDVNQQALVVKFIEGVMAATYSEEMAKRALVAVKDPSKIDEGILWCMDNENVPMETAEESTIADDSSGDSGDDMGVVRSMIESATLDELKETLLEHADDEKTRTLKRKLTEMWVLYMKNASSTSVSDFLGLEHLGYILQHLAETGLKEEMNRNLPISCQRGRANLIVCPESEVFHVCLSMYMEGKGKQLPLPTETEVLLCTPSTRYDEVELLLRRALGMHHHGKLFCLLNADRLEYEVGVQVEKFYEINSKGHTDFQLVIVCAREREDKSTIVTAFERFRVKTPVLQDTSAISQYIEKHLCVQQTLTPEPGAKLDPTNCTVRIVKSHRAGVGKSLKASRLSTRMKTLLNKGLVKDHYVRINMHRKCVEISDILRQLLSYTERPEHPKPRLFHLDIAHEVQEGVDDLLFNLVILGSLTDQEGYVWRRSLYDLYVIEALPIMMRDHPRGQQNRGNEGTVRYAHQIFQYLPSLTCWSPTESRDILSGTPLANRIVGKHDQTMDEDEFESVEWQRVYQYLDQYDRRVELNVNPGACAGNMHHCLDVLLRYCGLRDPSWAELRHFVWFLNIQLLDCDMSIFCDPMFAQDLPGFKQFVVKSMIQMSRDFATRSLTLSEESPSAVQNLEEEIEDLAQFQLKRRWESSPHPYVFFNADRNSMTFLGFNISPNGEMVDHQTGRVLEQNAMAKPLQEALIRNRVPLNENFDSLHRYAKIDKIHRVMGILEGWASYPDESYVLTTDNVKKIMAIYMRFRCGIPVIIMGETGCGKTRLIKFMCDLQKPPDRPDIQNMILMKVHGGTSAEDIERTLRKALEVARHNRRACSFVDTVVFFDEANTTEEIGLVKRVMVDNEYDMQRHGLKVVAACNPYRKHSDEMIRRLEQAGLGYHIQADETVDKLGQVPMRRLVYRVQALPQSMLPLVWDFGQLDINTETQYIQEMVNKCIVGSGSEGEDLLPRLPSLQETLSNILARSQDFMRQQEDECSFVSLRDVERVLRVMRWFYGHRGRLYDEMDALLEARRRGDQPALVRRLDGEEESEEENEIVDDDGLDEVTRSLILALGVCYHACLEKRAEYRQCVAPLFAAPFSSVDANTIYEEINACQDVFLNELTLEENIARNQALKENVFMMVVCIELRIPLFLVGKPGSSKSLAKTIVADAMQGDASRSELFKEFKSVHMVSYQCSPLATPQGIVGTFKQCADLQRNQDLNKYVSVVVLDEVGLAEDSPRMPLKALHPLLEDGCEGDETPEPHMKVAFIGISNWALDPAKMNRGILVQRGVPDVEELKESAKGICASDEVVKNLIMPIVQPMAKAYLELYSSALEIREFFGLRDFYSIIKMVYGFSKRSGKAPTWYELKHSILRNFGGLDTKDPLQVFEKILNVDKTAKRLRSDPDCTPAGLIRACLFGDGIQDKKSESRYLLILTENYAALKILQQQLLQVDNAQYIFGSSFPKDQEYTQVCRNINRIKICMETGQTVVLMNLENLYESLYDALNQYYVYLGGQRFVDLGLGTHRVKCKVHPDFRLIVVAEKQVVYKKFPIPLINRLEKHTLTMETILSPAQQSMAKELEMWAKEFLPSQQAAFVSGKRHSGAQLGDTFIGYERDTAASIVLQVSLEYPDHVESSSIEILEKCKHLLLQCATPEAIIRLRESRLRGEEGELSDIYFKQQRHKNIRQFLQYFLLEQTEREIFAQVTTHSKLLSSAEVQSIGRDLGIPADAIQLESLQAFDTEQQFCKQIKTFFKKESVGGGSNSLLVLQCDSGDENSTMIASARYNIMEAYRNEYVKITAARKHVIFIVQLPRKRGGCFTGFEGGKWLSYHIDDLQPETDKLADIHALRNKPVSELFPESLAASQIPTENMETLSLEDPDVQNNRHRERLEEEMDTSDATEDYSSPLVLGREQEGPPSSAVHTPEQVRQGARSRDIDTEQLIISCIHGAAAMLEDENTEVDRKTERVRILIHLLEQPGEHLTLMKVIQVRLQMLLREKEESVMIGATVHNWLANEAASLDSIIKSGTFRRSVWHNLEDKVTPLLAGIIAFCDSNANLDCLGSSQPEHWIHRLWLHLFSPAVIRLKYQDLKSVKREQELDRIQVRSHGCQGNNFQNSLPFSWVIKQKLDQLVHHAKSHRTERALDTVERLFSDCAEGRLVHSMLAADDMEEYLSLYRRDFLRMVYKCQAAYHEDVEYELIEQTIVKLATCDDSDEATVTEARLHFLHAEIQPRLQLFAQAIALKPDIVEVISNKSKETNVFTRTTEMTIDVQALVMLLETLTPNKEMPQRAAEREAWLEQVEKYRQFIERMLDVALHPPIDMHPHGDVCREMLKTCRSMWSRVCALQLFITTICSSTAREEAPFTIGLSMTLWALLGQSTDFKSTATFDNMEKFLRICNGKSHNHYLKDSEKCPGCEKAVVQSVVMPCKDKHVVCVTCVQQFIGFKMRQCPVCREDYPQDFKPKPSKSKDNKKLSAYKKYKERCSSFFMEIVSRLCFAGDEPPSDDVIQKLLGYVTKEPGIETDGDRMLSSQMNPFQDTIDPTPAVRSFLLQLLLRANMEEVREHLDNFFERGSRVLQSDQSHKLKLCLLFVHCMEDSLHGQYQQSTNTATTLRFATRLLKQESIARMTSQNTMEKLEAIASARLGLHITAEWLHKLHCTKELLGGALREIRQLIDAAAAICDQPQLKWPRLYLIRLINKRYGMDSLKTITEVDRLLWMLPEEARPKPGQNLVPSDRLVAYGQPYTSLKEAMKRALFSGDFQAVQETCSQIKSPNKRDKILSLVLHREITVFLIEHKTQTLPAEKLQNIINFINNTDVIQNKQLAQMIVAREAPMLRIANANNGMQSMINELLAHFMVVLRTSDPSNKWLQPFLQLATTPDVMQGAYLPTMPQDHFLEVLQATEEVRRGNREGNVTMYQCPNGHPYTIMDCGRPTVTARCAVCGATIGGRGHQAAAGNVVATNRGDTTATGHILGSASARSRVPIPERKLTSTITCILRLLTHMAMFIGACQHPAQIAALIAPRVGDNQVLQFLLEHILCDVNVLTLALNRSPDDSCLFIHCILGGVWQFAQERNLDSSLRSQRSREQWETRFSDVILNAYVTDISQIIQENTALMLQDQEKDANPLLKVLYETDAEVEGACVEGVEESPFMWRFRTRVTTEHLAQIVEENMAAGIRPNCQVLLNFVQQEHLLRAMRFLPDVLRLQQLLIRRFNNSIDGAEANTMTVQELLNRLGEGPVYDEYVELIQSFQQAWILIKQGLTTFVCGNQTIPKEYLNINITNLDEVHLAMLLPSWRGEGVCAVAVVSFLASVQNDFLESYGHIAKVTFLCVLDRFGKGVSVRECSAAHLIAYHPEKDLLPLVLATRNYTLLQGQDTQQHHDFETLQKQIEERFIKGKTRIQPDVETITFREDFTNAKVFKALNERLPQESLGSGLIEEISREYRHMTDIVQSLSLLDITIGYLVSVGKDGDMMLKDFMKEKLTLKKLIHSEQAQRRCRLKHVQSLWCLLSHMKTKELHKLGHDPFDNIEENYKEKLSPEMVSALHTALHHTNVSAFMAELYECIILHVTVKQDTQDEDYTPNDAYPLGYSLHEYIEEKGGAAVPILMDPRFPGDLCFKHCTATWREAYEFQRITKRS